MKKRTRRCKVRKLLVLKFKRQDPIPRMESGLADVAPESCLLPKWKTDNTGMVH